MQVRGLPDAERDILRAKWVEISGQIDVAELAKRVGPDITTVVAEYYRKGLN
jgi:hypothetical protein